MKLTTTEIVAAVKAGTHRITAHAGAKRHTVKYRLEKWHAARGEWLESVQNPVCLRNATKDLSRTVALGGGTTYTA